MFKKTFKKTFKKPLLTIPSGNSIDDQLKYSQELTQPILDAIGHELKSTFGRAYSEGDKLLTATVMKAESVENDIPQVRLEIVTFSDKEASKFNREYEQDPTHPAFYRKKNKIRRTIHD